MALALLLTAATLHAQPRQEPAGFTWGELAVLPEYCRDANGVLYRVHGGPGEDSPRAPYWISLMGEDFWHMHHYCRGLRDVNLAKAMVANPRQRMYLFERAGGEFTYMVRNVGPDFPLLPEIYLKLGETQLARGDLMAAKASLERSWQIKPDYWPAYVRWIDALMGIKAFEQALAVASEGLKHAPQNAELQQRLAVLKKSPSGRSQPAREGAAGARRAQPSASSASK